MTVIVSDMISRRLFSRIELRWSAFVPSGVNGILNIKPRPCKEYNLFHRSSVPLKHEGNQGKVLPAKVKEVRVWRGITVKELAKAFKMSLNELAFLLPDLNLKPDAQIFSLSLIQPAAQKLGCKMSVVSHPEKVQKTKRESYLVKQPPSKPENLIKRPPVVTVMGHVDHGKTTLLDSLRNSFVVEQEFGGITQHIGAFSVEVKPGERITFIDTPGHAAFTAMRSRGAETTDIVVLVIAADDGIMEQTVESIRIASAAQVPMVVAVNKIDKPTAMKIEDIKQKLIHEGIQVEDEGGDVQLVPISALKKINLDLLTEVILLQAELMNLKGDPTGLVEGVVIESKTDKSGIIATVIIKRGTLKKGKVLVSGKAFARVRRMLDENGKDYNEAVPSTPVQIYGWKDLPLAGEEVFEITSEKQARLIVQEREKESMTEKVLMEKEIIEKRAAELQKKHEEFMKKMNSITERKKRKIFFHEHKQQAILNEKNLTNLNPQLKVLLKGLKEWHVKKKRRSLQLQFARKEVLIILGDVFGSLEVLLEVLSSYDKEEECEFSIVDASVGDIKQNDILLAECFNAIIYAFNVNLHHTAVEVLKEKNIDIRYHNVIYKLIDDVKEELNARIPPTDEEQIHGEAEVLQNFIITQGKKKVPVAGARCTKGQLKKECLYRILRDGEVIYEGNLTVMKNEKKVVKSILKGMECGLLFESFPDKFKSGDKIICYEMVKASRKTTWDPGF